MIRVDESDRPALSIALSTHAPLDGEQVAALAIELSKPQYAGLRGSDLLHALNTGSVVDNPEPIGRVPKEYASQGEWTLALTRASNRANDPAATAPQKAVWARLREPAQIAQALPQVRLTDQDAQAGIAGLASVGLLTPEEVELLTTMPDPNYQPQIISPAPVATLFGSRAMIELSDLPEGLR